MKPYKLLTIIILLLSNCLIAQSELSSEICLTNHSSEDRYASYSPDGKCIVFESNRSGSWEIYLMDSNGQNLQQLTKDTKDNRRPSWHPDGKDILFESNRNGKLELYTFQLKTKKEKRLTKEFYSSDLMFASYSPSGEMIAVSLKESENTSNVILLSKDGNLIKKLTENNHRNYYPKWSNDGKEIVYFSRKETDNQDDEVYLITLETKEDTRLTNWHKHNFCPSWSNDDSKIVYVTSMEDTRPEIYIMDRNGNNQKRITNNEDGETLPSWHPTENKILVTAFRNGNYEICELTLKRFLGG